MESRCTQTPLECSVNPVKRLFDKVIDKSKGISGLKKVSLVVASFSGYSDETQDDSDSESNQSDNINQPLFQHRKGVSHQLSHQGKLKTQLTLNQALVNKVIL